MLLLITLLALGALYLTRSPRLAEASELRSEKQVEAYIDGKRVDSYLKETNDV